VRRAQAVRDSQALRLAGQAAASGVRHQHQRGEADGRPDLGRGRDDAGPDGLILVAHAGGGRDERGGVHGPVRDAHQHEPWQEVGVRALGGHPHRGELYFVTQRIVTSERTGSDKLGPVSGAIEQVGVVGGGIMGAGIAEVCARAGLEVVLVEVDEGASRRAIERLERSVQKAVDRGKLEAADAGAALRRVTPSVELEDLADRQLVVEAVVEDKETKLGVFTALAGIVEDADATLASNTSSIPIVELASATGPRAEHVLGMHFFNPVPVMALVEIIPSLLTGEEVTKRATGFAVERLGKDPIVAPDRAGFTVNALLIPYLLSAIRMLEQGLATAEDIDKGMVEGCGHPMGPLALADLVGLDTVMGVAETLYSEHREQLFAPPPLLKRLVAAGLLGRKTGRGLYSYS
jgi:3-hydroxybutyryl-CoA dehydrogenase